MLQQWEFSNFRMTWPEKEVVSYDSFIYLIYRLGWLKMHDVFRYWLPGHFWEGLYVK